MDIMQKEAAFDKCLQAQDKVVNIRDILTMT